MPRKEKAKKLVKELVKKRLIKKGSSSEFYKSELPEHIASAVGGAKESAAFALVLFIIMDTGGFSFSLLKLLLFTFLAVFLLYKICQAALSAWARLHKLHRIIEDEKYEIEHHRKKEKEELRAIYSAKGFSGALLEDVIDTLMADDNRLLQVMIEEEMGLTLGKFEHPLKQGFFAALGVLFTSFLVSLSFLAGKNLSGMKFDFFLLIALAILAASSVTVKEEKNNLSFIIFWNLAALVFLGFSAYFLTQFMLSVLN